MDGGVRTQHDVAENLVLSHLDVADGDTQAENLLELELDRRADLNDLAAQVFGRADGGRELASCSQNVSHGRNTLQRETHPWRDQDQGDEESA